MTETTNFLKEYNELKEQILKEGDTLVSKRDLLERFVKIDNEYAHRPWNLLQILANINILIGTEPCEDCVGRKAVMALAKEECETAIIPYKRFVNGVNSLPPVTPQSKVGHWIPIKNKRGTEIAIRCSCCGNSPKHAIRSDFCPNCGIKMESENK